MPTLSDELLYSNVTRIVGQAEDYAADVTPELGKNALTVSQPCLKSTITNAKITVTTSPTELKVSTNRLSNRQSLTIQPLTGKIFIGDSSVTASGSKQGVEISVKQIYELAIQDVPLYAIAAANVEVAIIEGA